MSISAHHGVSNILFFTVCGIPVNALILFSIGLSDCTARQCSPLRRKFMECYIIKPAQSLLMKHLVIGQR